MRRLVRARHPLDTRLDLRLPDALNALVGADSLDERHAVDGERSLRELAWQRGSVVRILAAPVEAVLVVEQLRPVDDRLAVEPRVDELEDGYVLGRS